MVVRGEKARLVALGMVVIAVIATLPAWLGVTPVADAAPVPTFTWTGAGAAAATPNAAWSNPANWVGGVTPTSPGPVNLFFPPVANCTTVSDACAQSVNDLNGLFVNNLVIAGDATNAAPQITGTPIIVGNLAIAPGTSIRIGLRFYLENAPLTWTIDGATVEINSIVGATPLTIHVRDGAHLGTAQDPFRAEANPLTIVGDSATATPATNGTVELGSINENPAAPLTISNLAAHAQGQATVGPVSTRHVTWTMEPLRFTSGPPLLQLPIAGNAVFDSASTLSFGTIGYSVGAPTLATGITSIDATGSVNLGSARLAINGCDISSGSTATILNATGGLVGTFSQSVNGQQVPINDGDLVVSTTARCYYRVSYDRTQGRVTIRAVSVPTATISNESGLASLGEVLRGTVSDTGGPGIQGVILYFHDYVAGGPSGAVLATCDGCGAGATSGTWSVTIPSSGVPGIYAFVAQAVDTAFTFGPPSTPIYQILQ